jgi:hypothetical protein
MSEPVSPEPDGNKPEDLSSAMPVHPAVSETPEQGRVRGAPKASSRWRWLPVGGVVILTLVAVGFFADRYARQSTITVHKPDDTFQLSFPGKAQWVNEPFTVFKADGKTTESSLRLFRTGRAGEGWTGRGEVYAVRVVILDPNRGGFESHQADATSATVELVSLINKGQAGVAEEVECNGYPATQVIVSAPDNRVFVLRGVAIEDQVYVLLVSGEGIKPDLPRAKDFFDSFRHATIPPPPADYKPIEGLAFRPLAKVPSNYWAAFAPSGDAVYMDGAPKELWPKDDTFGEKRSPGVLTHYHYPSFRFEAAYPLSEHGTHALFDWTKGRVFVIGTELTELDTLKAYRISRFDIDKLKKGPLTKIAANRPVATTSIPMPNSFGRAFAISPNGQYVFALVSWIPPQGQQNAGPARLCRYDATTLELQKQTDVPQATGALAVSPDGKSLYVVANRKRDNSASLWEYDPSTWTLRRELKFKSPGAFEWMRCPRNDRLFLAGRVIDPSANPPTERQLASGGEPLTTASPDGRLLLAFRVDGTAWLWDVETELVTLRPRKLGQLRVSEHLNPHSSWLYHSEPIISPDGKCILLCEGFSSSRVFWLAGAGPLPEVDSAVKWMP